MTEPLGPDAHLGLDRIADLEEGLLSPAEEQVARDHLAGCAECQADLAALAAVHDALLGDAEIAMPDDVAARIYSALAEQPPLAPAMPAATTLPVRTGPSRWERSRKPLLATLAAAACIALLSIGIIHLPRSDGSKASSAAAPTNAAVTTAGPEVLHSGRNYTAKSLGPEGAALISPPATQAAAAPTSAAAAAPATSGAAVAAATSGAAPTTGPAAPSAAPAPVTRSTESAAAGAVTSAAAPTSAAGVPAAPAPTTDPLTELRDPGAAQRCVALLLGSSTPPRVLDYATFDGKPAVIAVVDDPQDATKLAVIAVGPPGCGLYSLNFVSKP